MSDLNLEMAGDWQEVIRWRAHAFYFPVAKERFDPLFERSFNTMAGLRSRFAVSTDTRDLALRLRFFVLSLAFDLAFFVGTFLAAIGVAALTRFLAGKQWVLLAWHGRVFEFAVDALLAADFLLLAVAISQTMVKLLRGPTAVSGQTTTQTEQAAPVQAA